MKKMAAIFTIIFPVVVQAQSAAPKQMDLKSICSDKPMDQPLIIIDNGFCSHFAEAEAAALANKTILSLNKDLKLNPQDCDKDKKIATPVKPTDKWKVRFYASHSFTTFFNSDITFNSSRYKLEVKDYQWAEQSSRKYFKPETWKEEGNNPFQMIDEPSNTFVVSIEKNGNEFFLSAFHPKFTQGENNNRYMKGSIDGVAVDGYQNVNNPFHGYVQDPGESKIVRNGFTHKEMIFDAGYGHRFKLLENKKLGSITYIPSAQAGVVVGQNYSVAVKKGEWWEFEDNAAPYGVQGFGGSITNRVEYNTPKERFGLFYENKLGYYKMKSEFLDGDQKFDLKFMGNSVGMKFMLYNPNNHKKK